MILVYISFCLLFARKKLSMTGPIDRHVFVRSCRWQVLETVHPDLNKNIYLWYDCKTHLMLKTAENQSY